MNKFLKFNELFDKAEEYLEKEAFTIALDFINSAFLIDIDLPKTRLYESYMLRGDIRISMEQYKDSISDFDNATIIDPKNPRGFSQRGYVNIQIEEYENAITDFNNAIKLKSNEEIYFYDRGLAKFLLKRYADAIRDFDEAIKLNEKYSKCYLY